MARVTLYMSRSLNVSIRAKKQNASHVELGLPVAKLITSLESESLNSALMYFLGNFVLLPSQAVFYKALP